MPKVGNKFFRGRVNVVVVGDGGCGKTSLLYVFSRDEFPERYLPTVFETSVTDIDVGGHNVELQLWDTAGQEDYDRLRPLSYMDADVVIICYSVSSPHSLENVAERWLPEVRHFCPRQPIILSGNKVDLRPPLTSSGNPGGDDVTSPRNSRPEHVSRERGEKVAEEIGAAKLIECSAKTRHGVRDVFLAAASAAVSFRRHKHNKPDNCSII